MATVRKTKKMEGTLREEVVNTLLAEQLRNFGLSAKAERRTQEGAPDVCQGRREVGPVGRSKSVPPEVIGQRKCPGQLFRRSVPETGWRQTGRVSEDGIPVAGPK